MADWLQGPFVYALYASYGSLPHWAPGGYLSFTCWTCANGRNLYVCFHPCRGFSREDNATLFVAGFGSSALFGTFIGSMADKYGRRRFAASWMQVSKAI